MRIVFQIQNITGPEMAARMRAAISEEGVGWDRHFVGSSANLWERSAPEELWTRVGSEPDQERTLHLGGLAAEGKGLVWQTATSCFTYALLNTTSKRETPALIAYEGAEKGFLAQELLPDEIRQEVRIIAVEGTYGSFEGEDAFTEYQAHKRAWEQATQRVYHAMEVVGIFDHNQSLEAEWTVSVYKMCHDHEWGFWHHDSKEVDRLQEHWLLLRAWARLSEDTSRVRLYKKVSQQQFAQLVLELREIQGTYKDQIEL